jgi:hypothetical protein
MAACPNSCAIASATSAVEPEFVEYVINTLLIDLPLITTTKITTTVNF